MNIPQLDLPRVVIIGGGFAGLKMARKINTKHVQLVLIDQNNFHTFQPLMYQVATAGLEPDSIAYPLRKILKRKKNTHIRMAHVSRINSDKKCLETSIGELSYDYLIIATGAVTNYFGNDKIQELSMPMKTLTESLNLRSLVLQNFEKSLTKTNIEEQDELMNFVIVGAGPTGVELAGALSELKKHILPTDFPDLDIRRMQIHLIEAAPKVLNPMSEKSSLKATKFLKDMGVNVWTSTMVEDYDGTTVKTSKENFKTKTLIWAAGVAADFPKGLEDLELVGGRIPIDEIGRVPGFDNVFAIGDVATHVSEKNPRGLPMLGSVAQQQGEALAKNLKALVQGKATKNFKYKDKGTMATIGRNKAVVDLPRYTFGGFFAWMTWMFVHLMLLVDFRSRLVVLVNWVWSYINFDRGTRLIVRRYNKKTSAT
ncbi:MAG: NAD(P)/FAD-dependent oxidoreductase [Crocinitomicaceae bacterium]|nr:NAD(P)/FAD-dependent oxidoreductase [Crocinitomicaceae bacterium]